MKQLIYPRKIVKAFGVRREDALLERQEPQIDLFEPCVAHLSAGSVLILDFGREMRGGIRILCHESDESAIRVRFGESLGECCAELGTPRRATNDHALRDFTVSLPRLSDTLVGDTGFRFVRLDFSGRYTIKSIVCSSLILSRRAVFTYRGDKETERIFRAAKRTIDLCAASGYVLDGIKRDRLLWVGDLAPQVLALTTLYGKSPEAERSIAFAARQAPLPGWMNRFPTYSMWWIITLRDYYERTASRAFVETQMEYLEALTAQLAEGVEEDGELHYPGYFVDWARFGSEEEKDGARAINLLAAKAAVFLLEEFGKDAKTARAHWRRLEKKEICPQSKAVAALKYLATGALSSEEQRLLLSGGSDGMSTFMSYYILKAVTAFDPSLAASMLKEYYGGMLALGATTFWEDFEPEQRSGTPIDRMPEPEVPDCHGDFGKHCYVGFRRSLCHGWSAGILANIRELSELGCL